MPETLAATLASIGANIFKLRERRKLTQEALATATDLDRRFLQRVERGQAILSLTTLLTVANALGVKPAALFRKAKLPVAKVGRPRLRRRR